MNLPTYKAGPVEYWLAAGATEFLNGCLDGIGVGGLVGGGTSGTTAFSDLGANMSASKQIMLGMAGFGVTLLASGLRRFSNWHHNGHPFPNPYPPPAGPENPVI